jgi:hypothetical protein
MSPERGINRKEEQKNLGEREFVFWKSLALITIQEAERLGIPEGPVFVSPIIKDKQPCRCGIDYSPIIYHTGLIKAQHFHEDYLGTSNEGGIYHYMTSKSDFGEILTIQHDAFHALHPKTRWIAILDPLSMDPLFEELLNRRDGLIRPISSKAVNLLQIRAFSANQELKEGFLVTDRLGINLFPSSTKDHPFITELGFRIIEDGSVLFFNHSSLTPRNF